MLSRLNRFLREIDGSAQRRVLSTKEAEARDCARMLASLEEVYVARHGEQLFFGDSVLVTEDPRNAPEVLREKIKDLKDQFDAFKLLVNTLKILDEQDRIAVLQEEVTKLGERIEAIADLQIVRGHEGDGRDEKV